MTDQREPSTVPPEPMRADIAERLVAFARACQTAAKAVTLYPGDHPSVGLALMTLTAAAQAATAAGPLTLAVTPDTLTIDRCRLARPDTAVTGLAALLYAHQVGQLVVQHYGEPETWRRFLSVLAVPPDQARLRGGLARLWSSEGEPHIEVRRIDFQELLRERIQGDRVTWDRVVTDCLEGDRIVLDEWTIDLVSQMLDRPGSVGDLVAAIQARVGGDGTGGADAFGHILMAVSQFVGRTQPEALDEVLAAMAEATASLPIETLAPLVSARTSGGGAQLGRFIADLARRIQDGTIADVIATEARGGRGQSPALADAFCGLAPDATRQSAILTLARHQVEQAAPGDTAALTAWHSTEEFLLSYSDSRFVSDAYDVELHRVAERAVELDQAQPDPTERMAAWTHSVDDAIVRHLDAQMLVDLMALGDDPRHWRELADLAIARIDVLVVMADFTTATFLVESLHRQAREHAEPAIQTLCGTLLDQAVNAATMRHVASHLDTTDKDVVSGAKRFCHTAGTSIVGPLAEVLSREERTRARQHLVEILLGLGSSGRQAVERLKQSANPAVRRTAVLLLREFGGSDALLDLESLLNDAEPHVQRDATHAIALMRSDAAFAILTRALTTGTEHARAVITGVLSTLPNDDAAPVLTYLVRHAPCRGPMWHVYERAIQRLGAIGGRESVAALTTVMEKRVLWAPFKVTVLRRLAVEALARIDGTDATDALRQAARTGLRGARSAARRALAAQPPSLRR
jgi:HEAT repeat protein